MLQKKLQDLQSNNLSDRLAKEFAQLTGFIDEAIKVSSKIEVADRAETLTKTLMTLRDYMQTALTQDGYRKFMLSEILTAINHVEPPEPPEPAEPVDDIEKDIPKKNLSPDLDLENAP